jgi:integrase
MAPTCSILKAKGYILLSLPCEDGRLRYSTGVKYTDPLPENDQKRVDEIRDAIDNYAIKYTEILDEPIKLEAITLYIDKLFNPRKLERTKAKKTSNLVEDHKKMIAGMRAGEILKKKSKTRYSDESIAQYERMRERWEECAEATKGDAKFRFNLSYDMKVEDVRNLLIWLIKNEYSQNSIYNIVNNLKIFLKWAHVEKLHSNEIYRNEEFNVPQEEADAIAPTYEEVIKLYNHQFTRKQRERCRDFFVYGCFLALRANDLRRINDYHLVGNIYEVLTKKTGKKVTIPAHWICLEIYKKYNGVIPVMFRQNLGWLLPKICKEAGITGKKLITFTIGGVKVERYYERWELFQPHSMRRFYATWMYNELKYPPKAIMPITGHKSEAQFLKYVKIEDEINAIQISSSPAFQKPSGFSSSPSVES